LPSEIIKVTCSDGLTLVVEDHGGSGAPVILVHGLGFARRHWQAQVAALLEAGFRPITWDLRGFGDSEMPVQPYDVATVADDLERVRQHLGFERFHLVAHSLGGMVALRYVLDRPERVLSLVLASTSSHNGVRASAMARAVEVLSFKGFDVAIEEPEIATEVDRIVESLRPVLGDIRPVLRGFCLKPDPARARAWGAVVGFTVRHQLGDIAVPSLVVHGENDPIIPFVTGKLTAEAMGAVFVPVPAVGHNLPTDRADTFNTAMLTFLEQHR